MLLFTYGDSQGLHITYPALVQSVSVAITCARDNPDSAAHTTDVHDLGAVGYTVTAKRCAEIERTVGPSKRCSSRAPDLVFSSLARVPQRARDAARFGLIARLRRVLAWFAHHTVRLGVVARRRQVLAHGTVQTSA